MRCAVTSDILRRVLEREGFQVIHVQHVAGGEEAERWLRAYMDDADQLNVLRSQLYAHVDHLEEADGGQRRAEKGFTFDVYIADDGDSHFSPWHEAEWTEVVPGRPLARCWLRTARLTWAEGSSAGRPDRAPGLEDVVGRGYTPLAFRYLCLTYHYRRRMSFTWRSMADAEAALRRLRELVGGQAALSSAGEDAALTREGAGLRGRFLDAVGKDLDTAGALAVLWEVARGELPAGDKAWLVWDFDRILGLGLAQGESEGLPPEAVALIREREAARKARDWSRSDTLRQQIRALSIEAQDTPTGSIYRRLDKPGSPTGVKNEE